MSSILSVHGWLDIYYEDLEKTTFLLNSFRSNVYHNDDPALITALINGWIFQTEPLNGIITVFYGRVTKGTNFMFLEKMIEEVISCCKHSNGYFIFRDNEEEYCNSWNISDGKIIEENFNS